MRAVVTGASGHIGANLVRSLVERGDGVRALIHMDETAIAGQSVDLFRGDVENVDSLLRAFDGADVVYHLAGRISVSYRRQPEIDAINVNGTRNVVQACRSCGVPRLVHFSSIHASVSPAAGLAVDENTPLVVGDGHPPYDYSKACGERIVCEAVGKGLNAIIVAPTAVVGPHDYRPSFFGRVLLSLARRQTPVLVSGGYDWVDVRDVVSATLSAADTAAPGSKYLLSGHWCSVMEVARTACEILGYNAPRFAAPLQIARACGPLAEYISRVIGRTPVFTRYSMEALASHRLVSHDKATRELGYQPRAFRQTLYDTLLWFEQQGLLPEDVSCEAAAT